MRVFGCINSDYMGIDNLVELGRNCGTTAIDSLCHPGASQRILNLAQR